MNLKNFIRFSIAIVLFTGCSSKEPTHIDLSITSDKEINLNEDNVSSPLMLVFYELSSADKFSKYEYWDLVDKSNKKLRSDLISQMKHPILPNEKQTYQIVFEEDTKFLGIVAKFRDIKNSQWRYVINLEKDEANEAQLRIKKYAIEKEED